MTSIESLEATIAQLTLQLDALQAVNTALRTTRELLPVYRVATDQLRQVIAFDSCLIGVYEAQTNLLTYQYGWDEGVVDEAFIPRDLNDAPLSSRVIRGTEIVLIDDLLDDADRTRLGSFGQDSRVSRAWMGAPLISGGESHGLMAIMSYTPAVFGPTDAQLLSLLAAPVALAVDRFKREQQQRATIAQLSTPIIPVADGVLVLPLIGQIDAARAQLIAERTLDAVVARQAGLVLLDLTGVGRVDAQVLDALLKVVRAIELLGSRAGFVGMRAQIARAVAQLGFDLENIPIYRDLQSALGRRDDRLTK